MAAPSPLHCGSELKSCTKCNIYMLRKKPASSMIRVVKGGPGGLSHIWRGSNPHPLGTVTDTGKSPVRLTGDRQTDLIPWETQTSQSYLSLGSTACVSAHVHRVLGPPSGHDQPEAPGHLVPMLQPAPSNRTLSPHVSKDLLPVQKNPESPSGSPGVTLTPIPSASSKKLYFSMLLCFPAPCDGSFLR